MKKLLQYVKKRVRLPWHIPLHPVVRRYDAWFRDWRFYDRFLPSMFLLGVLVFLLYYLTFAPPRAFPAGTFLRVDKAQSLEEVAQKLKEKHIIHSVRLFAIAAKLYGAEDGLIAGEYFFSGPQNTFTVGRRLARGDFELMPVKVTIPEGLDVNSIATLLEKHIPDFDKQAFIDEAQAKEGYLFPDTYYFLPGEDAGDIISMLQNNFERRISDPNVSSTLTTFNKPLSDIVTMASLLEKEAANTHDRQIIAGILWKRISIGMPLQVDAVFPYIIGKNSFELTRADLKTESPYNTYTNKGLPPGPITNPGISSLVAAATPIKSNYLYYLSDMDGNFHFCANYNCQLANQRKYLK